MTIDTKLYTSMSYEQITVLFNLSFRDLYRRQPNSLNQFPLDINNYCILIVACILYNELRDTKAVRRFEAEDNFNRNKSFVYIFSQIEQPMFRIWIFRCKIFFLRCLSRYFIHYIERSLNVQDKEESMEILKSISNKCLLLHVFKNTFSWPYIAG